MFFLSTLQANGPFTFNSPRISPPGGPLRFCLHIICIYWLSDEIPLSKGNKLMYI